MKRFKLINIEGKWYLLLGMYDGHFYAGRLYDVFNDLALSGIIWERDSFFYEHDKWYGLMYRRFIFFVRGIISLYRKPSYEWKTIEKKIRKNMKFLKHLGINVRI